jgi:nucleoside-diphosphate-sugar epimerase
MLGVARGLDTPYDYTMAKLIFGCGYLGERVARRWKSAGHEVLIVTRSRERAEKFQQDGYTAIVADVTRQESLGNLPTADTVLFAVGYDRSTGVAGPSIEDVYAGGLRNVLAALPSHTGRFIYISTTGVYGFRSGEWVDEATLPDPHRSGGRASLAAEQALSANSLANRGIILRLAGIYGPGRVPFLDELKGGQPIPARTAGFLNLIHVDDAVETVLAADNSERDDTAAAQNGPRLYCVSDGNPVQRGEYYSEVARQIGAAPPRFVEPALGSPRAERAGSSRRVRNDRMLADLRVTLAYPDYRAGLTAILSQ